MQRKNAGQSHDEMIGNKSFENMAKFKCLGMTVTNLKCVYEVVKNRLNLEKPCCH
jgi:hypothetical protein